MEHSHSQQSSSSVAQPSDARASDTASIPAETAGGRGMDGCLIVYTTAMAGDPSCVNEPSNVRVWPAAEAKRLFRAS
eukprot:scaffold107070_cov72-Phaeocystis_antarctica.AAC.3